MEAFMSAAGGKKVKSGTFTGSGVTISGLGFRPTWLMVWPAQISYNMRLVDLHYNANTEGPYPFIALYRNNGSLGNTTTNSGYLTISDDGFTIVPPGSTDTVSTVYYYFAGRDD